MTNFFEPGRFEQDINVTNAIERIAERNGMSISKEFVPYKDVQYAVLLLSKPGLILPRNIISEMVRYVHEQVLTETRNVGRGDCAKVAGMAVTGLRNTFEKAGYGISTIGTDRSNQPIKFYKNAGFKHHIINLVEGENLSAAIDLTASYTMDNEQGNFHIFAVVEESSSKVENVMTQLTGIRWEAR